MDPKPPPPTATPGVVRPSTLAVRTWLAVGSVLAVLFATFATAQVVGLLGHEETTQVDSVDAEGLLGLDIATEGGTVRVVGADVDRIEIEAEISRGITETTYRHDVVGTDLVIRVGCGDEFANHWCQVTLTVTVPRSLDVRVAATEDGVHVASVAGRVEVSSTDEPIYLEDLSGDVEARVENASVRGEAMASPRAAVSSETGSVELTYREPPEAVVASSRHGDVTIAVPPEESYAVVTASGTGDDDALVRTDPASDRMIDARSDTGDVVVRSQS